MSLSVLNNPSVLRMKPRNLLDGSSLLLGCTAGLITSFLPENQVLFSLLKPKDINAARLALITWHLECVQVPMKPAEPHEASSDSTEEAGRWLRALNSI